MHLKFLWQRFNKSTQIYIIIMYLLSFHTLFSHHHHLNYTIIWFFSFQGESNIGLILFSEKNRGKTLTLFLLSKLQGLASKHNPLLLSWGNQSTSGTSVYVSSILSHIIFTAGKEFVGKSERKNETNKIYRFHSQDKRTYFNFLVA